MRNLSILLSSLLVLRYNLHFAHWSINGPNFMELHLLFQKQYEKILLFADEIAEHIRSEDGYPPTSLSEIVKLSIIADKNKINYNWEQFINKLIREMEKIKLYILELEDYPRGIESTLDELDAFISKQIWFLSSYTK